MHGLEEKGLELSLAERHLGVLVGGKTNMSQQCGLGTKRDSHILGCIKHGTTNMLKEVIVSLYSALLCAVLGCIM